MSSKQHTGRIVRAMAVVGLALSLTACGGGNGVGVLPGHGTGDIGPGGGSVVAKGGATEGSTVTVPPGALAVVTTVTIAPGTSTLSGGDVAVGPAVRFGPDGLAFAVPVTVSMPFTPSLFPAGTTLSALLVNHRDETTGVVTRLTPSSIDTTRSFVSVQTTSLGTFQAIVGELRVDTTTLPAAVEGIGYAQTVSASGGSMLGFTWSISAGALPPGLTLGTSGTPSATLSGTPTVDGMFNFTVQVSDSRGATATRAFALTVDPGVEITTTTLQNGVMAVPYTAQIAATAGSGAGYAWQVVAGALPSGLTLAPSGTPSTTLSGTPAAAGTFNFTVRVTDSFGGVDDQTFTLTVNAG
jgi:hypothetical protein